MVDLKKMQKSIPKTEGGILVRLWRNILVESNMIHGINTMVTRYINAGKNSIAAKNSKTKSSIEKNISSDNMSWRIFVDLLFNVLKVKRMHITITLTFPNGTSTVNHLVVDNEDVVVDDEKESEDVRHDNKKTNE